MAGSDGAPLGPVPAAMRKGKQVTAGRQSQVGGQGLTGGVAGVVEAEDRPGLFKRATHHPKDVPEEGEEESRECCGGHLGRSDHEREKPPPFPRKDRFRYEQETFELHAADKDEGKNNELREDKTKRNVGHSKVAETFFNMV